MALGGQGFVALQMVGQISTILDANAGGKTTLRGEHNDVVLAPEVGRWKYRVNDITPLQRLSKKRGCQMKAKSLVRSSKAIQTFLNDPPLTTKLLKKGSNTSTLGL